MANRFLNNIKINDAYTLPSAVGTTGQYIKLTDAGTGETAWADLGQAAEVSVISYEVRNETGSSIPAGSVVYVNGGSGSSDHVTIALSDASSESTSSKTFAVTSETIANNSTGRVVLEGIVEGLDTSGFSSGDTLWLSTTAGEFENTIPTTPDHAVFIGYAVRCQQNNGSIFVKIQNGYELGEIHDVKITTVADNDVIAYDSTLGYWVNVDLNDTYYTETEADNRFVNVAGDTMTGDLEATSFIKTGGSATEFLKADGSVDSNIYLTSETDPVFSASPSAGIVSTDITNWDTAYGWGDHASAGYLTSFTEADTLDSVTGRNSSTTNSVTVGGLHVDSTGAVEMPTGTTAERPTGVAGMFRFNSEDSQFEGYDGTEWGAIAGGGGGSSTIYRETFNGDNSTTQFTLSTAIADEANTQVYIDGVYQSKLNYSTSGSIITFSTAPPSGTNNIEVVHIATVAVSSTSGLVQNSFTGNGSTTDFTLSITPSDENFTFVFINGVYQDKSTYSVSGDILTFITAPEINDGIEVMSIGAVNIQQTSYLEYDNFTGTGSQTNFTLVNGNPSDEKFTMVFIQGVYQEKTTYSLSSGDIVFSTAPGNGYTIEVMSINGGGLQTTTSPAPSATEIRPEVEVISSNTNAAGNGYVYVFTASLTLTLPSSPTVGDSIKISNRSGVDTCVLGANGNNIMGSASDLTLDTASASFELIYSGSAQGWVIIGQ